MTEYDELTALIQKAANISNKYVVPRIGIVTKEFDSEQQYRFLVQIPYIGWDTDDKAARCNVCDTKGYTAPVVGDYVIVQFIDGNLNYPVITGSANYMKDMVTKSREVGIDVLYERVDEIKVTYDGDQLLFGNSEFQPAARQEDTTISSSSEDSAYWAFWSAMFAVIKGAPIPEAGGGAPSAFQAALALALVAATPSSLTGKINAGSDQVQIGDK